MTDLHKSVSTDVAPKQAHKSNLIYEELSTLVQENFAIVTANPSTPIFKVKTEYNELWDAYINSFEDAERQSHNCHCCRNFICSHAGLVTIDPETGVTASVLWQGVSPENPWYPTVNAMRQVVEKAPVCAVMLPNKNVYGNPVSGGFTHLVLNEVRKVDNSATKGEAFIKEQMSVLQRGLGDVQQCIIDRASELMQYDERLSLVNQVFKDRMSTIKKVFELWVKTKNTRLKDNLCWYYSAKSGHGVSNFRNSPIGVFLDNLQTTKSSREHSETYAINAFLEMTKSENYMRPTEAPSDGNIEAANQIVAKLGAEKSLLRRTASLSDIKVFYWKPTVKETTADSTTKGVFDKLKTSEAEAQPAPAILKKVSLEQFVSKYLPKCTSIQVYIGNKPSCMVLTAPVHADAPTILKQELHSENKISWLMFTKPEPAQVFFLQPLSWVDVVGVVSGLGDGKSFEQDLACILSKGSAPSGLPMGLFPSMLISEFHSVRSTIEAFSNETALEIQNESILGYRFGVGGLYRVMFEGTLLDLHIDRLE